LLIFSTSYTGNQHVKGVNSKGLHGAFPNAYIPARYFVVIYFGPGEPEKAFYFISTMAARDMLCNSGEVFFDFPGFPKK
jgi:hypothetical protein